MAAATDAKAAGAKVTDATNKIDFSDETLRKAWKDVTDAKSATNWILTSLSEDGKKLQLLETGNSGLKGFRAKLASLPQMALFGAVEVVACDKRGSVTSKRHKYVYVTFVGSGIKELARAQFNFSKGPVNVGFLTGTALTLHVNSQNLNAELNAKDIATKLLAAGGAHKPNSFVFGPGEEVSVDDLQTADSDDD